MICRTSATEFQQSVVMKRMGGSPRAAFAFVGDRFEAVSQQITSRSRLVYTVFAGLALSLVLFSAVQAPQTQAWLRRWGYVQVKLDYEKIENMRKNVVLAEWELPLNQGDDQNWAGLQRMRKARMEGSPTGSMWWDEKAEQYFISKLEESQFPANCSEAHWIAHYDWNSGLFSAVHIFTIPLFHSMMRGHTLVPIATPKHPAFLGCSANEADRNMQCLFNVTSCVPAQDSSRFSQILASTDDYQRTTWDELLLEDDEFFTPGGVTVTKTWKWPPWDTEVNVPSSSFPSYSEAHNYNKMAMWKAMGRAGKVGVVAGSSEGKNLTTCGEPWEMRQRRVDQVMVSLMSSWMINRVHDDVKHVADQIMSKYTDKSGHPLWKSPVLVIHVRQTDKHVEDLYWSEHGVYRPIENYALQIKQIEEEYGFRFPSIFVISDNGTTLESLVTLLSGNDSAKSLGEEAGEEESNPYVMYDWIGDEHLLEVYRSHDKVPSKLKYKMQTHFLATLYIAQKIADHAIVTYTSNVGRFIGEILSAKHRTSFVDCEGPLVTSLDSSWVWH